MAMPIRPSSQGDYERKWQHFISYLHYEGVQLEQCNIQHVLNFLTMLFDKRDLLAITIAHYRSALSVPLREVLNIDILSSTVSSIISHVDSQTLETSICPFVEPTKVPDFTEGMSNSLLLMVRLAKLPFCFY